MGDSWGLCGFIVSQMPLWGFSVPLPWHKMKWWFPKNCFFSVLYWHLREEFFSHFLSLSTSQWLILCEGGGWVTYTRVHVWRSEDNLEKLILSLHQGDHRDHTLGHQVWLLDHFPTEPINGPKIHFSIGRFQILILMQNNKNPWTIDLKMSKKCFFLH